MTVETVPCPGKNCHDGTVTRSVGTARWEVIETRCAICQGTGRVLAREPEKEEKPC